MTDERIDRDRFKRMAAEQAVEYVRSGMVVGLGAGTTAAYATQRIGALLRQGHLRDVRGIPCSSDVGALARAHDVPLTTLEEQVVLDLTIDGADEVDPQLNLIKGGGGALLHEKIVAQASRREVIVVDEAKLSPLLGTTWALPVEVVAFGWGTQVRYLEAMGASVVLRRRGGSAGAPAPASPDWKSPLPDDVYRTDQGNLILDCRFGPISDPAALDTQLSGRAGIVEHGLFVGLTSEVIVAGAAGIRYLTRPEPAAPEGRASPPAGPPAR
jgi:ribose 5-phosphate isomerase A